MSRLIESSLAGKISNILVESDIQAQWLSKELEREVPCLQKLIYKDGLELKYALDGDLDKECEKKIYAIAKSRGFDCDIEIDGYYVFITCSESNVNECDEPKEVKPIEKTRDELIRDHGTDDVDLINAGKEPEERVVLKESLFDEIADFMRDLDPYGYDDAYEGDDAEKHKQAVADIENDKETVKSFLQGIVDYEESTPDMIERAKYLLGALNESDEEPTAEDLEKEDEENKAHNKKAIEDRIGELRAAIADGVSDDEKEAMEKEIAELESHLNEGDKLEEGEDSQGALKAFSDGLTEAIRLQELRNAEEMGEFFQEAMGILRSVAEENGYMVEGEKLEESVSVATSDGSTVDTQDAASVQSNDGSVTVVTGDTTVVINNNPVEPALDIPQEEPVEEVPAEEIVPEEPIENEVPVEDEVIEESDDEYGIDANVDAKSLSVIKNQGITYMLQIEETSGKTTYWVCDNFNAETNEGDNADVFSDKESADKEYFGRVGLETPSEE